VSQKWIRHCELLVVRVLRSPCANELLKTYRPSKQKTMHKMTMIMRTRMRTISTVTHTTHAHTRLLLVHVPKQTNCRRYGWD